MAQVQFLAQELLHAASMAKKKRERERERMRLRFLYHLPSLRIFLVMLKETYIAKLSLFVFFPLWLHLQHVEVPGPGIEPELHLRTMLQLQQCWILNQLYHSGNS